MKYEYKDRARVSSLYPHALIELPVEIGEDTQIWHFVHVMPHARIGKKCTVGDGVHIAGSVVIGDGCSIQNGAQLFTGVTLEDEVFVGPNAVFTNVAIPRAFLNRKNDFRPTLVKRGASIGANATIRCGITIGEYAMIGAGAVVTKDVPAYEAWIGSPAAFLHAVCQCGARADMNCLPAGVTVSDRRWCSACYEAI